MDMDDQWNQKDWEKEDDWTQDDMDEPWDEEWEPKEEDQDWDKEGDMEEQWGDDEWDKEDDWTQDDMDELWDEEWEPKEQDQDWDKEDQWADEDWDKEDDWDQDDMDDLWDEDWDEKDKDDFDEKEKDDLDEKENPLCGEVEWYCLKSNLQDYNPEDQDAEVKFCFDPCDMEEHTCTILETGDDCIPTLMDPWEWNKISQEPIWMKEGEEDEQWLWVWNFFNEHHFEEYMEFRDYYIDERNPLCNEVEWNCVKMTCDQMGMEGDCYTDYCYDPCNGDDNICNFNHNFDGEPKTDNCTESLVDEEYWTKARADPIWRDLFEKDDQWRYVFFHWDEYHYGDDLAMMEDKDDWEWEQDEEKWEDWENNDDDDWQDEEDWQDWEEEVEPECDQELVCDFQQCPPEYVWEGLDDDSCWQEICSNECGDEVCTLWHATGIENNNWVWEQEECPVSAEEQFEETAAFAAENAEFLRQTFNGTLNTAFEEFCEDENCGASLNGKDIAAEAKVGESLSGLYESPSTVKTLNSALDDVSKLGFDVEGAKALLNAGSSDKANDIIADVIGTFTNADNEENNWVSGLLSQFVEGDKNEGNKRRGRRN